MTQLANNSIEIMVNSVPHRDPLAYAWGFVHGWRGVSSAFSLLHGDGAAYIGGWNHGTRCRNQEEPLPAWARPVN